MSVVETRQMSSDETRQMSTSKTGRCPVSLFEHLSRLSRRHLSCLNCRHLSCLNSRHQHQHSSLSISIQYQQSAMEAATAAYLHCAPMVEMSPTGYDVGHGQTRLTWQRQDIGGGGIKPQSCSLHILRLCDCVTVGSSLHVLPIEMYGCLQNQLMPRGTLQ